MATTKKKTKSTASKAQTGRKKSTASARDKSTGAKRSTTSRKRAPAKRKDYRPRLIGGAICFALAVFSAFGYFGIDAVVIRLLVQLEQGLAGYGYWITPVMLLWASIILIFHDGMPVRLRTTAALAVPLLIGTLGQILLGSGEYAIGLPLVRSLWSYGLELRSGGVLGGLLGAVLVTLLSKAGAVLVCLVLFFIAGMILAQKTAADLVELTQLLTNRRKDRREQRRMERELEPEEDWEEVPEEPEPLFPVRQTPKRRRARKQDIDIPVDADVEELPDEETEVSPIPLKKRPSRQKPAQTAPSTPAPPSQPAREEEPAKPEIIFDRLFPKEPAVEEPGADYAPKPSAVPAPEVPSETPADVGLPPLEDQRKINERQRREQKIASAEVAQELEENLQQVAEYVHPPVELLTAAGKGREDARNEIAEVRARLDDTFEAFGIDAHVVGEIRGPTVTQYELELGRGVKLSRVTGMADDITVTLGVEKVRIAPIPGKSQVVGVEIPNRKATPVPIRDVIASDEFRSHKSNVAFALGKDISGGIVVGNIAKLPHMLIAGTTGSGKSVCTNSIVISLLYRSSPEQVRLIMIDPKIVEFEGYNGIPHLLIPVVTDPKKAAGALQWAVTEMLKRYRLFAERHVRDLEGYNQAVKADPDTDEKPMPRIVVIIDELADLMLVASKEVEESICRLAQMGRASGMHLIIATQRPSADVITGLMKANIPSRIALTVSSGMESRIILDVQGAEKLLGHGDMLYNPVGANKPTRVQGCFISDEEVAAVVSFVKSNSESNYDDTVLEQVEQNAENTGKTGKKGGGSAAAADSAVPAPDPGAPTPDDGDPMMNAAIDVVVETGMASVSSLQRKLKLGYSRAARLVDQMEEIGVVGPFEGSKPRKVLITKEQWTEMKMRGGSLTELDQAKAMSEESDREAMAAEDVEMPPFEV